MKFGVHIALWMKAWEDDVVPYIERAASLDFDGVELSLLGMTEANVARLRATLEHLSLHVTCTTGLSPDTDVTSDDPVVRQAGLDYLAWAIRVTADLGSPLLTGVLYAPWGKRVAERRATRWDRAVTALKHVAPLAADRGVTLGIEAINRYETDLVNTAAQAVGMAEDVDEPNVGVLLDTYHMSIEEKDVSRALHDSRHKLVHLHCAENDRGAPGTGQLAWEAITDTLKTMRYDRWVTLEMFVQADVRVSPDLGVWRAIEPEPTAAARDGLAFLKERLA
jgi:D-psicose/D-tagatose/L-ribulose 3-epimerase